MDSVQDITARDWQLALGKAGSIVTDLADIEQCITVILTTPKGTDPLRPEFGASIWPYLDRPMEQAVPHLVRECWDALELWEPRIAVERIEPSHGAEPQQLVLRVTWHPVGQPGAQRQTTVTA